MRKPEEWFRLIADPELREKALKNLNEGAPVRSFPDLYNALKGSFVWSATPEGHDYWSDIALQAEKGQIELLPEPEESGSGLYIQVIKNTGAPWLKKDGCYEVEAVEEQEDNSEILTIMGFRWHVLNPKKQYKKLEKTFANQTYVVDGNYTWGDRVIPSDKWKNDNEADGAKYGYTLAPNSFKGRKDFGPNYVWVQWVDEKEEPLDLRPYDITPGNSELFFYQEEI